MNWPFVTRRAFQMVETQRDELKRELAESRAQYARLMNQFVWRATKIPLDPQDLPGEYRETLAPKPVADPSSLLNDPKKESEQVSSPRARLKQIEEAREKQFEEEQGKIHAVKEA